MSDTAGKRPNVLFLFSDQHNARCLSCAGHPEVQTPNLDALGAEGVRFENCYTQNPICTPSRISFLASLYPSTHGYYGLYGPEPVQPMTNLLSHFRSLGYRTGALGKLHTPRYWIERSCQFVYDEFIEFPKYLEGAERYEANDNRNFTRPENGHTSNLPLEHSCERALASQAIRFIRNEGEPKDRGSCDAPWCAWVTFSRPHQPYTPSEPYARMYPSDSLTLPPSQQSDHACRMAGPKGSGSQDGLRRSLSAYLGLVSQTDWGIGLILDELRTRGELDDTVIIYSSDHGDYAGEHGRIEKKGGISTRAITRSPLIVRYPEGASRGRVVHELAEAVDVFPTICDLAGVETPNTVQGVSLRPLLGDEPHAVRDSALTENAYRKAIATREWRYVANQASLGEEDELYDLVNDPHETHNLARDPGHAERARDMQRVLVERLVRARRPVNSINGGWHNHAYDDDGRIDLSKCGGTTNPYW
jgi:choline-sulfatase/uncharacterized sulfatase